MIERIECETVKHLFVSCKIENQVRFMPVIHTCGFLQSTDSVPISPQLEVSRALIKTD